jgi:hypothetical protein
MLSELKIFTKLYDLILWLYPMVNKFPKVQRFVLGQRIENSALELLRLMIKANTSRNKGPILEEFSVELDQLRILIRLSKDLKFMSINQYAYASGLINEIGKMLGGWIKSAQ